MSTGSVQGNRPNTPPVHTFAAGGAGPATPAAPASPAAPTTAGGPVAPSDRFADAAGPQTSAAPRGGAAKPTVDRSALKAKGVGSQKVGTPQNPAVFDKDGKINPASLRAFGQYDTDKTTTGDDSRCSCNATVAALAMRGSEAMLTGIQGAKSDVKQALDKATDPTEKKELQARFDKLDSLEGKAKAGQLTTKDINQFADTLYQHFDAGKHDDKIMLNDDVVKMQTSVGLLPVNGGLESHQGSNVGTLDFDQNSNILNSTVDATSPQFKEAQKKAAQDVLDKIPPGQSALVGVFNAGPKAPPGATDQPNHFVTAGKTKDGETYVYDPGNKPHYFTGKDAQQHLEKMIGVGVAGGKAKLIKDGDGNVIAGRRDVYAGASVIMQSEKTTGQIVNDVAKVANALNPANWF